MNTKLAAFAIFFLCLIVVAIIIRDFRRNKLSTRIFFMWLVIWLNIGIFALFPSLLDSVANFLNIGIRMNLIMMSAIFLLVVIIFYISSSVATHAGSRLCRVTFCFYLVFVLCRDPN